MLEECNYTWVITIQNLTKPSKVYNDSSYYYCI